MCLCKFLLQGYICFRAGPAAINEQGKRFKMLKLCGKTFKVPTYTSSIFSAELSLNVFWF